MASRSRGGDRRRRIGRHHVLAAIVVAVASACSGGGVDLDPSAFEATTDTAGTSDDESNGAGSDGAGSGSDPRSETATSSETAGTDPTIRIETDRVVAPIDPLLLGTNVAVWILPDVLGDERFHEVTKELGTGLLRFPGGSWSNDYEWASCEAPGPDECPVPWASRTSDLLDLMAATDLPGMWTVAFNRTAQEAAAAVAFFNGAVDDERTIGVDRTGRDWGTIGSWASLRAERGHPDPVRIDYWEVGNEIYGAVPDAAGECAAWGWENTWTCRPADYVEGDDEHDGYLDFHAAITAVDPTVEVGAIGIGVRGEWSNWDDTVMALAGDTIDFYAVHHYGSNGDATAEELLEVPASVWPRIGDGVRDALAANGLAADLPLAVTEHNMVAFADGDEERHMASAANAFYLADTIGQFAANGVTIGNQWLLVNGPLENGTNYALIDPDGMRRLPAYYAMALWARAGTELVETEIGDGLEGLSVYGTSDATGAPGVLVSNPTDQAVTASVIASTGPATVTADVMTASSLAAFDVAFNGSDQPSVDLADTPPTSIETPDGTVRQEFAPFSITLLRWAPTT